MKSIRNWLGTAVLCLLFLNQSGYCDSQANLPEAKGNLPETKSFDLGDGVTMEFVLIRPGAFIMGGDIGDEKPAHRVRITKPFYMGKYEVTQEQWEKIMGVNPSRNKGAKNPVETVSWNDCTNFIAKLKEKLPGADFSLPTEAQWEYACRAGTTTLYSFGDSDASLGDYAWHDGNSESKTHEVGKKKPNLWGVYDMHGNVLEWCADFYGEYSSDNVVDPSGPSPFYNHVLRGGCISDRARGCESAKRLDAPTDKHFEVGFRLVVRVR